MKNKEKFIWNYESSEWVDKFWKIVRITSLSLLTLLSSSKADDFFSIDYDTKYDTDYYEKYNPDVDNLKEIDYLNLKKNFFIDDGRLSADWIFFQLLKAQDVKLSKDELNKYDLEKIAVKINDKFYKTQPEFKKLIFQSAWEKSWFDYIFWKEMILVYVPYQNKIIVLWTILQGQYIEENEKKEYNVSCFLESKKELLKQCLNVLNLDDFKKVDIKTDRDKNNYFYKNWKLVWILENFWNEKILIKVEQNKKIKIANIKMWNDGKIIMISESWEILYRTDWSKKIKIDLETLDYGLWLQINN